VSAVDRGHAAERKWAALIEASDPERSAFRPRWKTVDVISMKAGEETYFDDVKTTSRPYERFTPTKRQALRELARKCGAVARLVWWPRGMSGPRVIPSEEWPPT
jgi:hypothetical protein